LNSSNYGFAFGLQNPFTYDQFIEESIYRAEAYHITGKRIVSGNTTFFDWNLKKLELEICSVSKFPTSYHLLFKDLPLGNYYCLKNNSFSLFGTFLNEEYQYVMIKLFECRNKTSDLPESTNNPLVNINNEYNNTSDSEKSKNNRNENGDKKKEIVCQPKQYIDEILAGTFFSLAHTDLTIDPTNYTNPNQLYSGDSYTTVSNQFFKEMHHYLNVINFNSDKGWLVSEIEKQTFLKLDFIKEMTDFRKSDNFLSYTLKLSTKVEIYTRSFAKVQNIAAEAGGFLKMISLVCLVFSFYYNKSKFYELIGQAILSEKSIGNKKRLTTELDSSSHLKLEMQKPFYLQFLRKNDTGFIPNNNINNAKINNFFNENADNITATNAGINNNNNNNNNNNKSKIASKNIQNNFPSSNRKASNKEVSKSNSPKKGRHLKPEETESNTNIIYKEEAKTVNIIPKRAITKRIKLNISFWESFRYLFCYNIQKKNKNFQKLNLIRHKVDELLDIFNLFRTINDFQRFKKLFLDNEQLKLFNLPYYQEINLSDPGMLNQTSFSFEQTEIKQKDVNADMLYNVVANKEDAISKKLLTLVNS
jgi:hypothetical protein